MFCCSWFIFCTLIAQGVEMSTIVSNGETSFYSKIKVKVNVKILKSVYMTRNAFM